MGDEFIAPIEPKTKKTSKRKKLMAVLLVFAMVFLVAGMALGTWNPLEGAEEQPENMFEVANYSFYALEDNTFGTYVIYNGKELPIQFRLDPRNASEIYLEEEAVPQILNSAKVYIAFNPNQQDLGKIAVAAAEISRITGLYGINTVGAYTEDSEPINPNIPLKTCSDATNSTGIIMMEITNSTDTGVSIDENNCVHVSGRTADDLILAADKFGFNLLGINV